MKNALIFWVSGRSIVGAGVVGDFLCSNLIHRPLNKEAAIEILFGDRVLKKSRQDNERLGVDFGVFPLEPRE